MKWHRHKGAAGWRILDDGRIVLEQGKQHVSLGARHLYYLDSDGAIRTRGAPATARTLLDEYGDRIEEAACAWQLPTSWVAAMVTIEAGRVPGTLSFDPISLADEDVRQGPQETPFHDYRARPHRVSAGLMQTLLSTAQQMLSTYGAPFTPSGPRGALDLCDLTIPERSLWLGAAYMRHQADKFGDDPLLLVGSYNAGKLAETDKNPWNLRTFGRDRVAKFAAYHNDILAVRSSQ